MSDIHHAGPRDVGPHQHAHTAPTTQQMRTVGQRRREAEEKLEHHLDEARHKGEHDDAPGPDTHTGTVERGDKESADIAAIQNDDRLTAADRADLIANQAIRQTDGNGGTQNTNSKP